MSSPIEGISGNSGGVDRVDAAKAYMEAARVEQASPVGISDKPDKDIERVENHAISGTDATPGKIDAERVVGTVRDNIEQTEEDIQEALQDSLSSDVDNDGIPDHLDATGKDSLTEQHYDSEAERLAAEQHAFVSILAMLNSLDLTKMKNVTINGDPTSLSAIATAGCAQMALMHSHQLNNLTETHVFNKDNIKKLLQDHQKKTEDEKRAALQKADTLLSTLPTDKGELLALLKSCPQIKKLPPAKQQLHIDRMLKNLEVMKKLPITPASAEA